MQLHSKGDDEDGGERAASREPGQLKTGSERFPTSPSLPSRSGETGACVKGDLPPGKKQGESAAQNRD
ncbi:MAG: hypothetical protein IKH57_00680 [Clostridia bacterium]|nr:hypothetical protein [Clostridia bacterium]MBR3107335.1 hypothetical protein [Clostridia bacterium]